MELSRPRTFEVEGETFIADSNGRCAQVRKELDKVKPIDLNSLDALVAFVKTECCMNYEKVYITVPNHKTVNCFTHPYEHLRNERVYLYAAEATDVPG